MTNTKFKTPAFIIDKSVISDKCSNFKKLSLEFDFIPFYSVKASSHFEIIELTKELLCGYSVSSLFEALLINAIHNNCVLHFTSPCIRPDEIDELCQTCNSISFNSLNQWNRFKFKAINSTSSGLRINPQLSFVKDERFNPSAKHSKLGVPLDQLVKLLENEPSKIDGLEGVHFHTNSESNDFSPLLETVMLLDETISPLLKQVQWINLGGGYYFDDGMDYAPLEEAINLLKSKYNLEIIIEPGAALVQEAGSLVSRVIDLFKSDGKTVAILDTTVNHLSEVLEFQYKPDVKDSSAAGDFEYILAGASCLAGDKFGTYKFDKPLEVGSQITFLNVGAYSLVKSHMFNGINLPNVYLKRENGGLELIQEFTYEDFLNRCGVKSVERLRKRA